MSESWMVASIAKMQQILKYAINVTASIFGVIFIMVYVWEIISPGQTPIGIVYIFIISVVLPYLLAIIYFINKAIIKSYTKKQKTS